MPEAKTWRTAFGIPEGTTEGFFRSPADVERSRIETGQGYVVRRAFELLDLDAVMCVGNSPLVYFKQVKAIVPAEVAELHRTFWNHGGAPLLLLISPQEVHVYSSLVRPQSESGAPKLALIEVLDQAATDLQQFLPTVESGEYFRRHSRSFDPTQRVDRSLLSNLLSTRSVLLAAPDSQLSFEALDALLCRLVFVCYLFDRGVIGESYLQSIGIDRCSHLRDVLALNPGEKAKSSLYDLFRQLGKDFNGDLFSDDLFAEQKAVTVSALSSLNSFFHATAVATGQLSFWPYDFSAIPVEAISAIYERFLKSSEKLQGAFYTPRFLAELVLDLALSSRKTLLNLTCIDPACGSGIFLVGLFNRIAEEWKRANPEAPNDSRAKSLRKVLCSLYGVDINPTACRITAFSLYLAYLDQLTPRDIQDLKAQGHKLPKLVRYSDTPVGGAVEGNIRCADFFLLEKGYASELDLVVGNPPWGSAAKGDTSAKRWIAAVEGSRPFPDQQIATAFVWKAPEHLNKNGRVCFLLPHGTIFNHGSTALAFQRAFFSKQSVHKIVNLVDYQRFLFEQAEHSAVVLAYGKDEPADKAHAFEYWTPKVDWLVTKAEIISVQPDDRSLIRTLDVLADLTSRDAPQIWKRHFWATPRDRRLLDRLALYPRLRDRVRQGRDDDPGKPWLIAEGFQPVGENDDLSKARSVKLPSKYFIEATSPSLNLLLLESDCQTLAEPSVLVRNRSNSGTGAYIAPHVLITKGFGRIAFADFDVSFRHALRGISGPHGDRNILAFLTAYLRSSIARYFLFQTSSNWGVSRQEIHVEELLRLPFPLPQDTADPERAQQIIDESAKLVLGSRGQNTDVFNTGNASIEANMEHLEFLVADYFDILPVEKVVVDDTIRIVIPSVRPSRSNLRIPTLLPSSATQRERYIQRVCDTLTGWARSAFQISGKVVVSDGLGIGVAVLHKQQGSTYIDPRASDIDVVAILHKLQQATMQRVNTFDLLRSTKVFDGDYLYMVKPLNRSMWTETAALNDADEIAGTILLGAAQRSVAAK